MTRAGIVQAALAVESVFPLLTAVLLAVAHFDLR